jgi:hypothetical protein
MEQQNHAVFFGEIIDKRVRTGFNTVALFFETKTYKQKNELKN